jgi:hypothetical protein
MKKKSPTSVWRPFMCSIRKTPRPLKQAKSSREGVEGAEAAGAAAEAAEAVDVEAAVAVAAAAAEAAVRGGYADARAKPHLTQAL